MLVCGPNDILPNLNPAKLSCNRARPQYALGGECPRSEPARVKSFGSCYGRPYSVYNVGRYVNELDEHQIEKVVDLAAPVSRVWRALTDHEEFGQWFRVRLDGPFKLGETTTGNITYPGYEHMKWFSVTERMEHERLFAFSWPPSAIDPDTTYDDDAKVTVEFRLQPSDNGTRLTITETGFLQFPESKRLEVLRSNKEGWDLQAENIAEYVKG